MASVLDKRTADSRVYDIPCAPLLLNGAAIVSVTSVTADQGNLLIGSKSINAAPITYLEDGLVAPANTVIQVRISGGAIPSGMPWLECTVRGVFVTTLGETLEATVILRLVDEPNV